MKKSKKIYEYTVDELKKKSKQYLVLFYLYFIMALIVSLVFFSTGVTSINNIGKDYTGLAYVLMLNLIFTSLVFGMIIFLWFISESSYYKMLQHDCDLMVYLKGKLGE